jgi:UPF0755 protein
VRQRGRDSLVESDAHEFLFGPDEDYEPDEGAAAGPGRHHARTEHGRRRRRRGTGRLLAILGTLVVVVVAAAAWFIGRPVYEYFHPKDYSGQGSGSVLVAVHGGDGAKAIGTTLHDKDVVASVRAFTDAAGKNDDSQNIQPGSYLLHKHMSAAAALTMLLDPHARQSTTITIPEGATVAAIVDRLSAPRCSAAAKSSAQCGLGLARAQVVRTTRDINALPLPKGYSAGSTPLRSVEGFLYPATYPFDPSTTASDALQTMITKFIDEDRATGFAQNAGKLHLTPYQALIIASIAQAEAKYPSDMAKVVRVILNRLAANMPLKIDAVSRYGAVLKGLDPDKVNYDSIDSPYNTYLHRGLPPTPISNPGSDAMSATVHPAGGGWLYYVNGSKDGHLYFTASQSQFAMAQQRCYENHWGCAAP